MARIGRIAAGSGLIVAGTFMLFLPGPGILTIAAGLAVLAKDIPLADRLAARVRKRVGLDQSASSDALDQEAKSSS